MNTVVLHIGIHKTGTSSIQATLKKNARLLRDYGVLYPESLPANHSSFFCSAFWPAPEQYHANKRDALTRATVQQRSLQTLSDLRSEIDASSSKTVLFSGEDICTFSDESIQKMKETLQDMTAPSRYRVICFARSPIAYAMSAIQENVKGNYMTIDQSKNIHIEKSEGRYQNLFHRFSEFFGETAIEIFSFEDAVAGERGLIGKFSEIIGIPSEKITQSRINESVSDESVFITSFLRARSLLDEAAHSSDLALLNSLKGGRGNLLNDADCELVLKKAASDIEFLRKRFGIDYSKYEGTVQREGVFSKHYLETLAERLPDFSHDFRILLLQFFLGRRGCRRVDAS